MRQEDVEFKASLGYLARHCLKKEKEKEKGKKKRKALKSDKSHGSSPFALQYASYI
jgi:hypothetical protein